MLEHEKEAAARQRTAAGGGVGERGRSTATAGRRELRQAGGPARPSANSPRRRAEGRASAHRPLFCFPPSLPGVGRSRWQQRLAFRKRRTRTAHRLPRGPGGGRPGPGGASAGLRVYVAPQVAPATFACRSGLSLLTAVCASETCSHNSKVTCGDSRFVLSS